MKCPICGGKTKKGLTNMPLELETGLLYIKKIPADVCSQCDEAYISDDIAAALEKLVETAKKQKVEIEVITFQTAAA